MKRQSVISSSARICTDINDYISNPQNYTSIQLKSIPEDINVIYKYDTHSYIASMSCEDYDYDYYYDEGYSSPRYYKVKVNCTFGDNALHLACKHNQLNIVKLLIEKYGMDINKEQYLNDEGDEVGRGRGSLPHEIAQHENYKEVIRYLLERGCNRLQYNGESEEIAKLYKIARLVDLLFKSHGEDDYWDGHHYYSYREENITAELKELDESKFSEEQKKLYINRFANHLEIYGLDNGFNDFIEQLKEKSLPQTLNNELFKIIDLRTERCLLEESSLLHKIEGITPTPLHLILKRQESLSSWGKDEANKKVLNLYSKFYPLTLPLISKLLKTDLLENEKIELIDILKNSAGCYLKYISLNESKLDRIPKDLLKTVSSSTALPYGMNEYFCQFLEKNNEYHEKDFSEVVGSWQI